MNESFTVPAEKSFFDPSQLPDSDATMKGTSSDEDAVCGSPSKQAKLDSGFDKNQVQIQIH